MAASRHADFAEKEGRKEGSLFIREAENQESSAVRTPYFSVQDDLFRLSACFCICVYVREKAQQSAVLFTAVARLK